MPDRNELIASLEGRIWGGEIHKGGYIHVPQEEAEAILELLKEQEPAPPIPYQQETSIGIFAGFKCGVCNAEVFPDYRYCPICGKAVKWDA